ncbi:YggW family oxidoreductase [Thiocystis violacea]|nr:YggW family oxidoreductase [Thiocystis violacea]
MRASGPPLSLYVHIPWCVRKCPYCDFNSHGAGQSPPFERYVAQLLADLDEDLSRPAARRPLQSIFIGGGTPSLLPGGMARRLLAGIQARMDLASDVEITLEANPGTVDARHFQAYREAGVNRLSIGVQSLSADQLGRLGRIHDPAQARAAVRMARAAGFENLNLDMMFALPGQTLQEAARDLQDLIALEPEHISYYQLTIEPHTRFHAQPPERPDEDLAADMSEHGIRRLEAAGYARYEVSAYARPGRPCRHNLNYWRFGDYLGLGAGAHGKLTDSGDAASGWSIRRTAKRPNPQDYLDREPADLVGTARVLSEPETLFEFALNVLRLNGGFQMRLFEDTTGLDWSRIHPRIEAAVQDGLLCLRDGLVRPTALGERFLDDLVTRFMPGTKEGGA